MTGTRLYPTILAGIMALSAGFASADPIPVQWDTIYSYEITEVWEPDGDYVALAVSNFGEIGQAGAGGVNMDFTAAGTECGSRPADSVYLYSASPFLLEANASATEVTLTCSYGQTNTDKSYSWIPVDWDPEQVLHELQCYIFNISPCGKFVNREGTIAVEMFRVVPYSIQYPDPSSFLFLTRLYSIDGQTHERLSFGWVVDWNIPSDLPNRNVSGSDEYGVSLYFQGTDTTSSETCQLGSRRFATSVADCGFKSPVVTGLYYGCGLNSYGTWHGPADLLQEVVDPEGVEPPRPDALAWWTEIGAHAGKHVAGFEGDLATWHTTVFDYELGASDTVYSWMAPHAFRDRDPDDFPIIYGFGSPFFCQAVDCTLDCPWGKVGNPNQQGGEEPTISDVTVMIDARFIAGDCVTDPGTPSEVHIITCMGEADINNSGGPNPTCDDITISDISYLVDYLFIGGPSVVELPCVYF